MTGRKIPNYNFLGVAPIAFCVSLLLVAGSVYLFIKGGDAKYGVDFTGGHEFLVRLENHSDAEAIRSKLNGLGFENAIVQAFELGTEQFLIRLEGDQSQSDIFKQRILSFVKENFGANSSLDRSDFVGPAVGSELKFKAIIAISLALLGMLAFISYRFEFAFALGAVVALFHDVIVSTGVYLLTGHTFSMGALAAALTIVGYSVNDTIVVFDRIREEIVKSHKYNLVDVMNNCINMVLSRTLITHLLTLFSALALYLFGGGAISDLSIYLLAGIVTGSYSTIYIACPVVLLWHKLRGGKVEV